ncbi:hypothetical protein NSTC731_02825 [Nostoc sp. DSM 114167]|jgi:hypothetical protein
MGIGHWAWRRDKVDKEEGGDEGETCPPAPLLPCSLLPAPLLANPLS